MDTFNLKSTILGVLKPSEIVDQSSPEYKLESQTWQAHRNLHPRIMARPNSVDSLARLVRLLIDSDLDFAVRCQGVGDASARDVLISLANFKELIFDKDNETIIVGAGCSWAEVETNMAAQAPGYQALSARTSFVGIGGMILHGGLSWISSEFGLASDPHNFLDAQVVKMNGDIIWASQEPELLYALRGGGHEFAIVTAFKLKVYQYPQDIYTGSISFPRSSLPELAQAVTRFAAKMDEYPRTAFFLYNLDLMEGAWIGAESNPGIGIWLFDANGEEHGRDAFKWALEIDGAIDKTKVAPLRDVTRYGDALLANKGACSATMSNITISAKSITPDLILRTWQWLDDVIATDPDSFITGTFVLLEFFQKAVFHSVDSAAECAWPHTKNQHLLQLGVGRLDEGDYPTKLDLHALNALQDAGRLIVGEEFTGADYFTNFLQPWNDYKAIFGENYERLQAVKKKYDPKDVLVRKN